MRPSRLCASLLAVVLAACITPAPAAPARSAAAAPPSAPAARPAPEEARAFAARVNAELRRLLVRASTAEWIKSTYITDDTERNAAAMNEDLMEFLSRTIPEAARFDGVAVDPETARMLHRLKLSAALPAPRDPEKRRELAETAARLEGMYGKGKACGTPVPGKPAPRCRDLLELEDVMKQSRDWAELLEAWSGWHAVGRPMRPLYERLVALGNEGAREIGFRDMGDLWRAGYDTSPAELEADVDRLWAEVKPLYEALHCHVRARLQAVYGRERVPDGAPIPAHLLGNMWAQEWGNLYPELEPYPGVGSVDLDAALVKQGYDAVKMTRLAEAFFTSLGLDPLPETFWERSMLVKPRDREVVCHASAWDVTYSADLRIKMCIRPTEEDFITIHHELGHNYYQRAYVHLPVLFHDAANDGFHEAIGDTISPLSMTPTYLRKVGLLRAGEEDERAVVNHQMKNALEGVAFLPFGRLMDQWRWDVFSGKVPPERWDAHWWELRRRFQGVDSAVPRAPSDFDPGAKYHIPAHVSYLRYFLARVYQYQFHRSLCEAAGWKGPLHACSIHGSQEAGRRLKAAMELGASRPWPDAMEVLTGQRKADAGALLEYYAPLRAWLAKQNAGRKCGW